MRPRISPRVCAAAWIFSVTLRLAAQSFTATISGAITDPSGGAIPGAQVTVTSIGTSATFAGSSDAQGRYVVPAVLPGLYTVSAQAAGFKQLVRTGIRLEVEQRLHLDLELQLGAVTETVEVAAQATLVQSETSSLGSVIDNRHLINVPLNSRNAISLVALIPGARTGRAFGDAFNSTANVLINGGRGNSSEILTDGIANTASAANPINTVPVAPPVEAIQEFKVQTNSLSAEFGRTGGGVLNFIFKSGTNELHGTLFEFLRNSALDANSFFSNQRGIRLASFRRNQFGGVLGGPVVIPRLIDGRNGLFFFVSYDGLRQSAQNTALFTFPTAAERVGDFSRTMRLVGAACRSIELYDPFTTRRAPDASFVRDPFADNVIPASRLDPAGLKAASFYPLPRGEGLGCAGADNSASSAPSRSGVDQVDFRIDFNPTEKDRIFLRVSPGRRIREFPAEHYNTLGSPNRWRLGHPYSGAGGSFSYTRVINPSLLAEFRFGFARYQEYGPSAAGNDFDMQAALGFRGNFQRQMNTPLSFPRLAVTGYGTLGTGNFPFTDAGASSYQWLGNVTKIRGPHTLKTGVEFRLMQSFGPNPTASSGDFSFPPSFTQGPNPTRAGPAVGNGLASLLIGLGTGSVQILPRVFTSNNYVAVYVQDDYRLTRKLTLNLGLRFDFESGRKDRYHHLSWFNFHASSPLANRVAGFSGLRGGLEFVSVGGNPGRQFDTDRNNFGPRFGFAYSVDSRTVVRGGYGLSYEPYSGRAVSTGAGFTGFSSVTTWVSSLDGITPQNVFSDPFPNGLIEPPGSSLGLLTSVGEDLGGTGRDGAFDRRARVGYAQQWNFGVQRGLPGNVAVTLAYAGAKGTKLTDGGGFEENQLPPAALALGNQLLGRVANPFLAVIRSGPLAAATTTLGQLLRPFPQFARLTNFRPNAASSTYHAFEMEIQKRFSDGVQFVLAYTAGKSIDDSSNLVEFLGGSGLHQDFYNRRGDRSLSLHDVAQRLVVSYVLDLPFGRGRAIGATWGRWPNALLGGWQLNGMTTFQGGLPFLLVNRSNNSNAFSATQRPNVNGDPKVPAERPTNEKLARWFDPNVFSQPAAFTFGNGPRVLPTVRSDGINNHDISVFKNFSPARDGKMTLQFRVEFFNTFNTPEFSAPDGAFGAANFGVVSGQANSPRQIQFGLKVLF